MYVVSAAVTWLQAVVSDQWPAAAATTTELSWVGSHLPTLQAPRKVEFDFGQRGPLKVADRMYCFLLSRRLKQFHCRYQCKQGAVSATLLLLHLYSLCCAADRARC